MVGTSAGGRQPKAIIAINRETGEIRSGQVETGNEYDYYILKFGDKKRSTAELEKTYYDMAKETGINMMESKLIEVEGVHHLLTRRFDRDAKGKLHTQTLAAMYPEADTYESCLWYAANCICQKWTVRMSIAAWYLIFSPTTPTTTIKTSRSSWTTRANGDCHQPTTSPIYLISVMLTWNRCTKVTTICLQTLTATIGSW